MLETKYKDITYNSELDLGTLETNIYYVLNNKGDVVNFDYKKDLITIKDDLKLYDLRLGQYILEADKKGTLDNLKNEIESKGTDIEGNFEYKNKHYLILYRPKINGEIEINLENVNEKVNEILKDEV